MRRWAGALAGAALVVASFYAITGHAASLSAASNSLGSGKSSVTGCDPDGVSMVQVLTGNNVTSVTVGGIAAACAAGSLSVTVNNGTTNSTGAAVVPVGGGSVTVPLGAAVAMKDADEIDVTITGP
jgi:hypothetical protein